MLSEYFKFHRNTPMFYDKGLFRIMDRYYEKIRDHDYKKVKYALKQ